MITHHLFPTPVAFFNLGREITQDEFKFLTTQEMKPNMGNVTSTERTLHKKKELSSITKFLKSSVDTYFNEVYQPRNKVHLRFTQSWLNYTKQGQFHHRHAHPNSFISGVFYVQTNDTDRIHFFKSGYDRIKLPVEEGKFNLYNSDSWWLPVKAGQLVLFPSSLEHMVEKVEGEETRISLAFNTFPVGDVGDDNNLTGLKLKE